MGMFGSKSGGMKPHEPNVGASGKHYFNPKVMSAHGDEPTEQGHPEIHHIEIHPHGPSSEHPHHVEVHGHDGQMTHGGEHANYDEAAMAGKSHMDGSNMDEMETDDSPAEESMETKSMAPQVHKASSGAY